MISLYKSLVHGCFTFLLVHIRIKILLYYESVPMITQLAYVVDLKGKSESSLQNKIVILRLISQYAE